MSIFNERIELKPVEYPDVLKYKDAIRHSYWIHTEWDYLSDVNDFKVRLNNTEKNAIKNTLLAISQIEVSVKKFWSRLGDHLPKPEINDVGMTFAESEVRHSDAYSHLLEVLGLNTDFKKLLDVPEIKGRIDYLSKYLKNSNSTNIQLYTVTLALFSLFVENVSLFSQFAIIRSFTRQRNLLKDIDNVVQATMKEELIHGQLGTYIINIIRKEYPEWFNRDFYEMIYISSKKSYDAEAKILDWIFEEGELDFISKRSLKEFIKHRFNESIVSIGGSAIFDVDEYQLKDIQWFIEQIYGQTQFDFFHKKSTNYSKRLKPITENDLF